MLAEPAGANKARVLQLAAALVGAADDGVRLGFQLIG